MVVMYRQVIDHLYAVVSVKVMKGSKFTSHFFSAPEPKAQVHYCDHALSVVRPSVHPSLIFHIFDFSSETAE